MGLRRDPAVRLCVACGQLKRADQFELRRRKCVACRQAQPGRVAAVPSHGRRRRPTMSDSQLLAIEQTLLEGVPAHLAAEGDSLAAAAAAALVDRDDAPNATPGLAQSNRPANPAERRDAIAQAWRDEPGITDTALAERFGVSRRTIRPDIQALQEQGIQRPRRRKSHRTQALYAAMHRRFLAWLTDELGRPPLPEDLSGEVLARWIAHRASAGGHGGGGLSSASLRLECTALRQLVRQAGRPELAASLRTSRQQAPPPRPSHPSSTSGCCLSPT
jgi:transposase